MTEQDTRFDAPDTDPDEDVEGEDSGLAETEETADVAEDDEQ